jgi:alpha-galactosidase
MERFLLLLTIMYLPVQAQESSIIKIETENSALVLKVGKNKKLYQTYLGTKLNNSAEYEAVSKDNTTNKLNIFKRFTTGN